MLIFSSGNHMKKTFVHTIFILLAMVTSAFPGKAQPAITRDYALDTVLRLPEVQKADAYVRRVTKEKRHLFSMLYGEPDREHPYFWVVVGEDNGMSFVTHFGFYVYTKSRKILYLDNFTGQAIDLETWRHSRHKKRI